jgi:uncharacterized membrane-anchored protein
MMPTQSPFLPADDALRLTLHNEVHSRPTSEVSLPAIVHYVAVFSDGVTTEQACQHLQQLPNMAGLSADKLLDQFIQIPIANGVLKWEKHTEFTRYIVYQTVTAEQAFEAISQPEAGLEILPPGWLAGIPGRTFVAARVMILPDPLNDTQSTLKSARQWLGQNPVVASMIGVDGHSLAVSDFLIDDSGFEQVLIFAPLGSSATRIGRVVQRVLEVETYRMMALRGLPVAKALGPQLTAAEKQLASMTVLLEDKDTPDQKLLDELISLAARIEQATALNLYRFSASRAYDAIVNQRITELREKPVVGTQTVGEFMRRRLSPAIATVASTSDRLMSLAERVSRTSSMLRTRVDIATEDQNQAFLEKLTRGQALQLRMQKTVEGLSIAAISYYVVSLVLYLAKAAQAAGVPIKPEIAAGISIPFVIFIVWRLVRRIHKHLNKELS